MLRGNTSVSHYSPGNVFVWMTMAFQAGALNIGGFLACHAFVSHATGNVSMLFGVRPWESSFADTLPVMLAPAFFLLGAMLSGILVDRAIRQNRKPKYYVTFSWMFAILLVILAAGRSGALGTFGEPLNRGRDFFLLVLLSLVCGIQNGTLTTVSRSVIRTTHLTGLLTDLGIGVVRALSGPHGDRAHEMRANWMRLGIIAFFACGCAAAGLAFRRWDFLGFALPLSTCGLLLAIMLYYQIIKPAWAHPR